MKIYTPYQIREMSNSEMRHAYAKVRKAANQRLTRMERKGLGTEGAFRFPKVKDLSANQMAHQLAEASRYMRDPRHTIPGERRYIKNQLNRYHEQGYEWINEGNFYEFTEYMEDLREQYGAKVFDSGDAVEVYNNAQKIGIDSNTLKENFEFFAEHLSELERMRPTRSAKGATMPAIKKKIKRLQNDL